MMNQDGACFCGIEGSGSLLRSRGHFLWERDIGGKELLEKLISAFDQTNGVAGAGARELILLLLCYPIAPVP